jgi:hypothetical protein
MGQLQLAIKAAYELAWAHGSYQDMLPMIMIGPLQLAIKDAYCLE